MPSQPARPFSEGIAHHFSSMQPFNERLPCLPTSLIEILFTLLFNLRNNSKNLSAVFVAYFPASTFFILSYGD
jgi:hypothetical protein